MDTKQQLSEDKTTPKHPARILGMFVWGFAYSTLAQGCTMLALPYESKRLIPSQASTVTGGIAAAGSLCQFFGLVISQISDRTTLHWGRRRPYILGAAIGVSGASIFWVFGNIGDSIAFIAISYILLFICLSCGITVLEALMPDLLPEKQHGIAGGFLGLLQVLGTAIAFILFSLDIPVWACMIVFAALSIVTVLPTLFCSNESKFVQSNVNENQNVQCSSKIIPTIKSFGFSLTKNKDWLLLLCIRICFYFSTGYSSYTQYWVGDTLQIIDSTSFVSKTGLATLGICVLLAFPAGWLTDKFGRKPFLVASLFFVLCAVIIMMFAKSVGMIWAGLVLVGFGNGIYPSVEMAICCDCQPRVKDAGKFMAEFAIASTIGQLSGQLIDGVVLQSFSVYSSSSSSNSTSSSTENFAMMYSPDGYYALFGISAGFCLLGLILSFFISPKRGKLVQEQLESNEEPNIVVAKTSQDNDNVNSSANK